MRMFLNADGTINALGLVNTYPLEAPEFIVSSGHLRWQHTGGDINNPSNWNESPPDEQPEEVELP